jgi:hypothetical protein
MFFGDYPTVNLASPYGRGYPSSRPSRAGRRHAQYPRHMFEHPMVTDYDDSHYDRETQKRALAEERRRQEMHRERQLYEEKYRKQKEAARRQQIEQARQRKIQAFRKKMTLKKLNLIQKWWRGILQQRRLKREQAASVVITRAMRRFIAVKHARNIANSLRQLQVLTSEMDAIAPANAPPPTDKKQRLLVEDTLEKIVLKVDLVDTYGSLLVRSRRKQLVVETNNRLKKLDESGPTMMNSSPEEYLPPQADTKNDDETEADMQAVHKADDNDDRDIDMGGDDENGVDVTTTSTVEGDVANEDVDIANEDVDIADEDVDMPSQDSISSETDASRKRLPGADAMDDSEDGDDEFMDTNDAMDENQDTDVQNSTSQSNTISTQHDWKVKQTTTPQETKATTPQRRTKNVRIKVN